MPGLPTLTVKPQIWDKWCKEPYTLWEPTQLARDFWPGIALVICYSRHHDLLKGKDKDAPRSQMAISMTLAYVPEHWPLASFEESSHIINAVWAERDLVGMISLTRLHKKAPYLLDVSYQEYGQHMIIAPLTLPDPSAPPDNAALLMCGPPHDFAVRAFHCKHSSSRNAGKMTFYAPPAFQKAPQGELLVLNGCNGKTWGGTGSGVDHHEVLMAPLHVFMKLNASNGIPVLPEYAFMLCEPGSWPFPSTMDINILPEACLAYDTLAESENQLEEPASTLPVTNSGTSKKCKHKGKGRSKSAGAIGSASKASSGRKNQISHSDATLASQVAQELQLSSEGSDSDDPAEIQQGTPAISDSQPLAGSTRPESGTNLPGTSVSELDTPIAPHEDEKTEEAAQPPEASTLVPKLVVPDSTEEIETQPTATPTLPVVNTTSIPVPTRTTAPPGFPQQPTIASTSQAPTVPPDAVPGQDVGLPAQIADRSMTYLAQSLAVSSTRGNPDIGAFSRVMTALWKACGLMSEGFWEACLDVKVVVQMTLAEATAHNRAFATKAAKDLDLWTSALQLLFDTDAAMEAEMEIRRAHARSTGQVVSDWILARSREVAKDKFPDGGPVQMALLKSFAKVEERCMRTLKKVADQVLEIMAQHVLEGQVGVFLAALYQLICTQQQGITSMVVAQAGVPVHLGVNNWATTASMTRLFAQVIPDLGSLHGCTAVPEQIEYMPIPPKGSTMVPTSSFPREQVWDEGTATRPIYLGNETDSGISSMGWSTPVKGSGGHHQPLTSIPKPKLKLLVVAQQHRDELAAK